MIDNNLDSTNLELASRSSRIKAFIIDDVLITLITLTMLWGPINSVNGDYMAVVNIMNTAFIQIVILKLVYQTFFLWYYGATLGKIIAKIKVIDFENFGKISLTSALLRSVARVFSESIFYIGFMVSYYTDSRQTLHDKVAKTLVVNA